MKEPKVDLKNIKTFRGMDGYGFNANVYINGIKCLFAMDSGDGGCMNFHENIHDKNSNDVVKNIKLLNDYIASLPPIKYSIDGGNTHEYEADLDSYIEDKLNEIEKNKFEKKKIKLMETAIIIGNPSNDNLKYSSFKFNQKLHQLPKFSLQQSVNKIVHEHCTNGNIILNTNLINLGITVTY